MLRYLRALIAQRRTDPQDDLLTGLIQAEEAGDTLSEDELLAMIVLLLIAGHETTVNLIGNGTLALLEHPAQLERLRQDPALMPAAVEELLRYSSPVEVATERYRPGGPGAERDADPARGAGAGGDRLGQPRRAAIRAARHAGPGPRRRTGTWRSGRGRIIAWVRRWPGWKGRSLLRRCCGAAPRCSWCARLPRCAGTGASSCAGWSNCRWRFRGWGMGARGWGLVRTDTNPQPLAPIPPLTV